MRKGRKRSAVRRAGILCKQKATACARPGVDCPRPHSTSSPTPGTSCGSLRVATKGLQTRVGAGRCAPRGPPNRPPRSLGLLSTHRDPTRSGAACALPALEFRQDRSPREGSSADGGKSNFAVTASRRFGVPFRGRARRGEVELQFRALCASLRGADPVFIALFLRGNPNCQQGHGLALTDPW